MAATNPYDPKHPRGALGQRKQPRGSRKCMYVSAKGAVPCARPVSRNSQHHCLACETLKQGEK